MTKNKELDMSLSLDLENNSFELMISNPESGESDVSTFGYNPEKHKSFNEFVGNEIYNWLNLWWREDDESDETRDVEPIEEPEVVCDECFVEPVQIHEPEENALSEEGVTEPFPTY